MAKVIVTYQAGMSYTTSKHSFVKGVPQTLTEDEAKAYSGLDGFFFTPVAESPAPAKVKAKATPAPPPEPEVPESNPEADAYVASQEAPLEDPPAPAPEVAPAKPKAKPGPKAKKV